MNVAFYDLLSGIFRQHIFVPGATPEHVRSLVPMLQLEALQKGDQLDGIFVVVWEGKGKEFFSVFVMHDSDYDKLNESLLDSIKNAAFELNAKK